MGRDSCSGNAGGAGCGAAGAGWDAGVAGGVETAAGRLFPETGGSPAGPDPSESAPARSPWPASAPAARAPTAGAAVPENDPCTGDAAEEGSAEVDASTAGTWAEASVGATVGTPPGPRFCAEAASAACPADLSPCTARGPPVGAPAAAAPVGCPMPSDTRWPDAVGWSLPSSAGAAAGPSTVASAAGPTIEEADAPGPAAVAAAAAETDAPAGTLGEAGAAAPVSAIATCKEAVAATESAAGSGAVAAP